MNNVQMRATNKYEITNCNLGEVKLETMQASSLPYNDGGGYALEVCRFTALPQTLVKLITCGCFCVCLDWFLLPVPPPLRENSKY